MKRIKSSIPLVILGTLTILCIVPINHVVQGITVVFAAGLIIAYLITFILNLIFALIRKKWNNEKFNFIPVIVTIVFFMIIPILIYQQYRKMNQPVIFTAVRSTIGEEQRNGVAFYLKLYDDDSYSVEFINVEYSVVYSGDYEIENDTLYLKDHITSETDGIVSEKYLMKEEIGRLIPIEGNEQQMDTLRWLEIEHKAYGFTWI